MSYLSNVPCGEIWKHLGSIAFLEGMSAIRPVTWLVFDTFREFRVELHGIREAIDPGDPLDGDPTDHAPLLPQSQELALRSLQRDSTMKEMLGEEFIREYTAAKQCELESFRSTVTPWEREQYVETL